jgi:hypothetical protein
MGWSSVQNWSTSNSFSWTPTVTGNFKVAVWVKSAGNIVDEPENNAYGVVDFTISGGMSSGVGEWDY